MEGIAAYADDEGSNPSTNEDGSSNELEEGQVEDSGSLEKAPVMDAVDDNAEDGYAGQGGWEGVTKYGRGGQQRFNEDSEGKSAEGEEGELSMTSGTAVEASSEEVGNEEENSRTTAEKRFKRNGKVLAEGQGAAEEEEDEDEQEAGERPLPQAVTTPFSLASFLSSMAPQITEEEGPPSQERGDDADTEFAYINGTYARVAKTKVDISDLDRRLDDLRQQRKEEIGLLKMYGLDDRNDRGGDRGGGRGGDRNSNQGRDRDRDHDDSRRRSRSRSRDRDRDRRRSKSRDRRRSRSRERRRSRSRERSSRRDRESPDRSRGRDDKDRYGRDKDRFGRDRDDKDRYGREKDKFGREKDRFGRDRPDPSRERDREDRREDREFGRSRSPRNDRRDSNRDRHLGGRGQQEFPDIDKMRNERQEQPPAFREGRGAGGGGGSGGEGPYLPPDTRQEGGFSSGSQDFYPSQQQQQQQPPLLPSHPLPVPPPDSFPQGPFSGPPPTGGFNQPPPPLDPFCSIPPPPQPWMGPGGFQQQQPPPPLPPHLLGSGGYSQPPPPLPPAALNPMNNGDINTLKQNLSLLTGAVSDAGSGSPGMVGSAQGYQSAVGPDPSQLPLMAGVGIGERFPSACNVDAGSSDMGSMNDDDPMDLDLPSDSGCTDDFQSRVVAEVKNAIRPFFTNRQISKDEYKEILKKCVPKVTNSGEINPKKISNLVGAYVKKMKSRPK